MIIKQKSSRLADTEGIIVLYTVSMRAFKVATNAYKLKARHWKDNSSSWNIDKHIATNNQVIQWLQTNAVT